MKNSKERKWLWVLGTGLGLLALWLFFYRSYVMPAVSRPMLQLEQSPTKKVLSLKDGKKVRQEFQIQGSEFERVGIRFAPKEEDRNYQVIVRLEEAGGDVLQEWKVEGSRLSSEDYTPLGLTEPVKDAGGKTYALSLETQGADRGELGIYLSKKSDDSGMTINDETGKRMLSFEVRGEAAYGVRRMYLLFSAGLALLMGLIFTGIFRKWSIQSMFPVVGLTLGLLYMTGIPLTAGPDETRHMATAYALSNEMMGREPVNEDGYVISRAEDEPERYGLMRIPNRDSVLRSFEGLGNDQIAQGEGTLRRPLDVSSLLYVPQALGITLARLMGWNGLWLYYLARLFGLLFYLWVTYLAIRILPFGKRMLFFVACLPMCMQQAAVITYDTMILSFSFLMIAHVLYLAYEKEQMKIWDWIPSMICMAVLLPAKIVYVFLALLLLLIPGKKYAFPFGTWCGAGAAVLGGILASAAAKATKTVDILSRQDWTVPWGDEPAYTLTYVLEKPLETIGVFWNSLVELGKDYLGTMIGRYLCTYFDIRIDYWILWAFLAILILASLREPGSQMIFKAWQRGLFVLIFAGTAAASCLSMLLAYTSIYSPVLQGVQGRYFLPALPVLLLALRGKRFVWREERDGILVWGMGLLQILTLSTVFLTIISR